MLTEAFQVAFDCFADVLGGFGPGSSLGNASRQCRASRYKYSVLVWLQINAILHYPAFYQSSEAPALLPVTTDEMGVARAVNANRIA